MFESVSKAFRSVPTGIKSSMQAVQKSRTAKRMAQQAYALHRDGKPLEATALMKQSLALQPNDAHNRHAYLRWQEAYGHADDLPFEPLTIDPRQ